MSFTVTEVNNFIFETMQFSCKSVEEDIRIASCMNATIPNVIS